MGARLRLFLSPEEDYTLFELRTATTVPQRVKDRAQIIRLNAQGTYVEKIATHFHCHPRSCPPDPFPLARERVRRAVG